MRPRRTRQRAVRHPRRERPALGSGRDRGRSARRAAEGPWNECGCGVKSESSSWVQYRRRCGEGNELSALGFHNLEECIYFENCVLGDTGQIEKIAIAGDNVTRVACYCALQNLVIVIITANVDVNDWLKPLCKSPHSMARLVNHGTRVSELRGQNVLNLGLNWSRGEQNECALLGKLNSPERFPSKKKCRNIDVRIQHDPRFTQNLHRTYLRLSRLSGFVALSWGLVSVPSETRG